MSAGHFQFALRFISKLKIHPSCRSIQSLLVPLFANKDGNKVLQVLAKSEAKTKGITGIEEEGVGVQISSRPVDSEANSGLKKYEISLEMGMNSRQKTLLIYRKDLSVEKLTEKLKQEMNS